MHHLFYVGAGAVVGGIVMLVILALLAFGRSED